MNKYEKHIFYMTHKRPSCKHGVILYGIKCLNCEREKQEEKKRKEAIERTNKAADKLNW